MVSVVIRNKNQSSALHFLLKNLTERYADDIGEIIVLDNLSTDDSENVSKHYAARFITIEKFSYGGSANKAAEVAQFNIIVIFSAHSYPVSHDFFKLIKNAFDNNSNLAGVRCLHNSSDYKHYINNISAKEDPNRSGLIFSGSAFCKAIWEKHPFRADVATFEDKEWSKRILELGYDITFVNAIFCYEIKRSKQQELFRFKNDLIGNYQLWHKDITYKNACNYLIVSLWKQISHIIQNIYFILKRFFAMLKFIRNKPKPFF